MSDLNGLIRPIGNFASRMRQVPEQLRRDVRTAVRTAASPIVAKARANASWSTRIPKAIRVSSTFAGKNAGVTIRVALRTAPHGRAYEDISGKSRGGTFRHPVFGNKDRWVSQPTRPFIAPAVQSERDRTLQEIDATITQTLARAGFASR